MNPTLFRFASSAAMCLTMAGVLAAQSTPPPTGTSQADQSRTQGRDNGTVTVAGCLMQEKDVAALKSSGGGSGSGDAFVLTNAKMGGSMSSGAMGSGSTGTTASGTTGTGTSGTATSGTSGSGTTASGSGSTGGTSASGQATAGSGARTGMNNMFRVVGQTDELKKHVNHQVEIQGTLSNRETASGAGSMGSGSGTATGSGTGTGTGTGTTGTTGSTGTGTTSGSTGGTSASGQTGRQMGGGNVAELRATSVRMISATCQTGTSQQ
jgi:hypothetical protein